jgi:hypothetical protein
MNICKNKKISECDEIHNQCLWSRLSENKRNKCLPIITLDETLIEKYTADKLKREKKKDRKDHHPAVAAPAPVPVTVNSPPLSDIKVKKTGPTREDQSQQDSSSSSVLLDEFTAVKKDKCEDNDSEEDEDLDYDGWDDIRFSKKWESRHVIQQCKEELNSNLCLSFFRTIINFIDILLVDPQASLVFIGGTCSWFYIFLKYGDILMTKMNSEIRERLKLVIFSSQTVRGEQTSESGPNENNVYCNRIKDIISAEWIQKYPHVFLVDYVHSGKGIIRFSKIWKHCYSSKPHGMLAFTYNPNYDCKELLQHAQHVFVSDGRDWIDFFQHPPLRTIPFYTPEEWNKRPIPDLRRRFSKAIELKCFQILKKFCRDVFEKGRVLCENRNFDSALDLIMDQKDWVICRGTNSLSQLKILEDSNMKFFLINSLFSNTLPNEMPLGKIEEGYKWLFSDGFVRR